jgi:hypothetical protein
MPTKLRRRDTTPKHQGISNLEDMFFNYFEKRLHQDLAARASMRIIKRVNFHLFTKSLDCSMKIFNKGEFLPSLSKVGNIFVKKVFKEISF